jgi:SAM-dependent methyltransferase
MRLEDEIRSRLLSADADWPAYLRYWMRVASGAVQPVRYRGSRYECPCCRGTFARFADFHHSGETYPESRCPHCGSLQRQRVLWLFIQRETDMLSRPTRVLQIAPDFAFFRRLSQLPLVDYVTGDLQRSPMISDRIDITAIPFGDASFDLILCSHVLEHVPDDRTAARELRRVLRPDGIALLQHPLVDRPTTDEDPSVVDSDERLRRWGQADHVRAYGRDYVDRLAAAGFEVTLRAYQDELPETLVDRARLLHRNGGPGAHLSQDIAVCRVAPADVVAASTSENGRDR